MGVSFLDNDADSGRFGVSRYICQRPLNHAIDGGFHVGGNSSVTRTCAMEANNDARLLRPTASKFFDRGA